MKKGIICRDDSGMKPLSSATARRSEAKPPKQNETPHTVRRERVPFTKVDDEALAIFIAEKNPGLHGRRGNWMYQALVQDVSLSLLGSDVCMIIEPNCRLKGNGRGAADIHGSRGASDT